MNASKCTSNRQICAHEKQVHAGSKRICMPEVSKCARKHTRASKRPNFEGVWHGKVTNLRSAKNIEDVRGKSKMTAVAHF